MITTNPCRGTQAAVIVDASLDYTDALLSLPRGAEGGIVVKIQQQRGHTFRVWASLAVTLPRLVYTRAQKRHHGPPGGRG